jgi:hypothetical protein
MREIGETWFDTLTGSVHRCAQQLGDEEVINKYFFLYCSAPLASSLQPLTPNPQFRKFYKLIADLDTN